MWNKRTMKQQGQGRQRAGYVLLLLYERGSPIWFLCLLLYFGGSDFERTRRTSCKSSVQNKTFQLCSKCHHKPPSVNIKLPPLEKKNLITRIVAQDWAAEWLTEPTATRKIYGPRGSAESSTRPGLPLLQPLHANSLCTASRLPPAFGSQQNKAVKGLYFFTSWQRRLHTNIFTAGGIDA